MGLRRMRTKLMAVTGLSLISLLVIVNFWPAGRHPTTNVEERSSPRWWSSWKSPEVTCHEVAKTKFDSLSSSETMDTADLYENLDFNVPEGSRNYWNRTFEERYLRVRTTWDNLPLEVIVVPYSHIDPGWLRTYDEYFEAQVKGILDNMVNFMNRTTSFTFIWSEISYFSQWFNKQDPDIKAAVIKLLRKGQLEIVAGGWVMPDEASTHYWSIVDQFVEGHQWLKWATGIIPNYGWSVDVFGHSSSLQLLLTSAGMNASVILRTHYAMKSFLASTRELDFYWKQSSVDSFILCHMAPSDLYSFKHTCGPDPRVCLQFDFRRINNEYTESISTTITEENVRPKAERLVAQYGRYASLYPHNVLLVPLGDDFRYDKLMEWEQQYVNYDMLFEHINKRYKNVHVRFGTVADYFDVVSRRVKDNNIPMPSLRGDFLPYADIYADGTPSYWTGLYTTRPFEKSLVRELEHWLRTAEILYTFSQSAARDRIRRRLKADYSYLMSARHSLDLFQHHDAVTGTSRTEVARDYRQRLHNALKEAMTIVSHCAQYITMPSDYPHIPFTSRMYLDLIRTHAGDLTKKITTSIPPSGRSIVLFNSLTFHRRDIIRVKIKSPFVKVIDKNGVVVPSQVNPVWNETTGMLINVYEILFVCNINPLSFATYELMPVLEKDWESYSKAEISLLLADQNKMNKHSSIFAFKHVPEDITVIAPFLTAKFSANGLLKEIYTQHNRVSQKVTVKFFVYLSKSHRNGAYLFHPSSENPVPLENLTNIVPLVRIARGKLVTEVTYTLQPFISVTTRIYTHDNGPTYLDMESVFDISTLDPGIELFMRIESDIKNNGQFFTDSNGMQMLRRKHVNKLPLQGNVYPVVSSAYIEDEVTRLNLLTSRSHGFASPSTGNMEIMLDRRMENDDMRGIGQGVMDNRRTSTNFRLYVERTPESGDSLLTIASHESSLSLLYPIVILISDKPDSSSSASYPSFSSVSWPRDFHLVNLRTLPSDEDYFLPSNQSLLVILKQKLTCDSNQKLNNLNVSSLFLNVKSFSARSLTGVRKTTDTIGSSILQSYYIEFNGL